MPGLGQHQPQQARSATLRDIQKKSQALQSPARGANIAEKASGVDTLAREHQHSLHLQHQPHSYSGHSSYHGGPGAAFQAFSPILEGDEINHSPANAAEGGPAPLSSLQRKIQMIRGNTQPTSSMSATLTSKDLADKRAAGKQDFASSRGGAAEGQAATSRMLNGQGRAQLKDQAKDAGKNAHQGSQPPIPTLSTGPLR